MSSRWFPVFSNKVSTFLNTGYWSQYAGITLRADLPQPTLQPTLLRSCIICPPTRSPISKEREACNQLSSLLSLPTLPRWLPRSPMLRLPIVRIQDKALTTTVVFEYRPMLIWWTWMVSEEIRNTGYTIILYSSLLSSPKIRFPAIASIYAIALISNQE